jgi:pyruvate/2-oxoglutarate/acetoin dehydrogenase E1 component
MTEFGAQEDSIILGQAVAFPGTGMTSSFIHVPPDKLLETPVFEDVQLGLATGLALAGYLPLAIYPRINFLLLAMSQLVLHLDALPRYSPCRPRVLIRTAVATPVPLDPGPQHLGDYRAALTLMLQTVEVVTLRRAEEIVPAYRAAARAAHSTILVEFIDRYDHE